MPTATLIKNTHPSRMLPRALVVRGGQTASIADSRQLASSACQTSAGFILLVFAVLCCHTVGSRCVVSRRSGKAAQALLIARPELGDHLAPFNDDDDLHYVYCFSFIYT